MLVVLRFVLMAITGEIKALFLTIAGALLVWPMYTMAEKNRPRVYDAARIPDDLMPQQ